MFFFANKGFSLLEIVISVAILSLFATGAIVNLSSYRDSEVLSGETSQVLSLIHEARSNTISSKLQKKYSVRLNEDRIILYEGNIFASSTPSNKEYLLHPRIHLSEIALLGGGLDISFERLTGETFQTGYFKVTLRSDPLREQKIAVKETGFVGQE